MDLALQTVRNKVVVLQQKVFLQHCARKHGQNGD